jgi:predicted nucleic acid-binding protein
VTRLRVVCDAAVALAWLQDEEVPSWASDLWANVTDGSVEVVVPCPFWLEVGNTLSRRSDLADEQALEGLLRLQALGFATLEADQALQLRALQLARAHDLTTYDALYLALADSIDVPLATLDTRLAAAALSERRAYAADPARGVREATVRYATDSGSLSALGARLAELRG